MTDPITIDTAKLDALFAPFDSTGRPGLVVGVAHRGIPVYRKAFGLANAELPYLLTPQTRLRIGSTTKHFCCLLIMLLAEEGKLSPDDSVRKHIPELGTWADGVTLARLMSHTSGARCSLDLATLVAGAGDLAEEAPTDMMLGLHDVNFAPGEGWNYCNGGYALLTEILKRLGGKSFEEQLKERILDRVGMHNTEGRPLDTNCLPNTAMSHVPDPKGGWKKGKFGFAIHGEGNIVSTVDDMLLWLKHMSAPVVGSAETWAQMTTPARLNNGASAGYGFGLFTGEYRGVPIVHHGGDVPGGSCQMLKVPDHELDIVIMTNTPRGAPDPGALAHQIIDAFVPGLAPPLESPDQVQPITGEFFSRQTARYLRLAELEGKQAVQIGPFKLPLLKGKDGAFRTPLIASLKLHISDTAIGLEEYETVDTMDRLPAPTALGAADLVGRYEVPDVGGTAVVEGSDPPRLRFDSRWGSVEYRLDERTPTLWLCSANQANNSLADLPLERDGDDLLLSNGRVRRLRLKRSR